ncbi:MAG TPA: hypothetical protein VK590_08520 [Saprospiraceae bacterium]|nr:hypothetical protein [Saprospiraceae bacterium]
MKTFLIVVGVLILVWLGMLTMARNDMQTNLDKHDEQLYEHDRQFNSLDERYQTRDGFISEDNPIDKTEDKLDQTEDKADQKIEMPYEKDKTNENTNLKKDDNEFPKANNKDEIDLKPNPHIDNPFNNEKENSKNDHVTLNNESVVAFGKVTDRMFRGYDSVEAFQLDQMQEEVITAFKVR